MNLTSARSVLSKYYRQEEAKAADNARVLSAVINGDPRYFNALLAMQLGRYVEEIGDTELSAAKAIAVASAKYHPSEPDRT